MILAAAYGHFGRTPYGDPPASDPTTPDTRSVAPVLVAELALEIGLRGCQEDMAAVKWRKKKLDKPLRELNLGPRKLEKSLIE